MGVHHRLRDVLRSAPWTYWPLRFDKADCTSILLEPAGRTCMKSMSSWCKAVHDATSLRNSATQREMISVTFAFAVYPIEGEMIAQARRDLSRDISNLLRTSWDVMEFSAPRLVCWETWCDHRPYSE